MSSRLAETSTELCLFYLCRARAKNLEVPQLISSQQPYEVGDYSPLLQMREWSAQGGA